MQIFCISLNAWDCHVGGRHGSDDDDSIRDVTERTDTESESGDERTALQMRLDHGLSSVLRGYSGPCGGRRQDFLG